MRTLWSVLYLVALVVASPSLAATMSSASYRVVGANANGGGSALMLSTAPSPAIGALGASVGQSEALGFSGSLVTLRTIAPGFWPLVGGFPHLDSDADLIQAFRDNCPFAYNPTQSDLGGILSLAPDGVGDPCQCGDVNDDALVDGLDIGTYRAGLAAIAPIGPPGLTKCSVIAGPPQCTVRDVSVIARALAPVPYLPGIDQTCAATTAP